VPVTKVLWLNSRCGVVQEWMQTVAAHCVLSAWQTSLLVGLLANSVTFTSDSWGLLMLSPQVLDIDPQWRMHQVSDGQRRRVQICVGLLKLFKVKPSYLDHCSTTPLQPLNYSCPQVPGSACWRHMSQAR
jgi:hypothetical protein